MFVNDIRPSERSIQRYRREYGRYFEVLFAKMTIKKSFMMKDSLILITLLLMEPSKKHNNSNNNTITKKKKQEY